MGWTEIQIGLSLVALGLAIDAFIKSRRGVRLAEKALADALEAKDAADALVRAHGRIIELGRKANTVE